MMDFEQKKLLCLKIIHRITLFKAIFEVLARRDKVTRYAVVLNHEIWLYRYKTFQNVRFVRVIIPHKVYR